MDRAWEGEGAREVVEARLVGEVGQQLAELGGEDPLTGDEVAVGVDNARGDAVVEDAQSDVALVVRKGASAVSWRSRRPPVKVRVAVRGRLVTRRPSGLVMAALIATAEKSKVGEED